MEGLEKDGTLALRRYGQLRLRCCWENLEDAVRWSVTAGAADFYELPVHLLRIALPAEREGGMTFLGPNLDQIGPAWVLHNELLGSVQVEEMGDAT